MGNGECKMKYLEKKYYRDFYGTTASIKRVAKGYTLTMVAGLTRTKKTYTTFKSARIAMGRMSDGWSEVNYAG